MKRLKTKIAAISANKEKKAIKKRSPTDYSRLPVWTLVLLLQVLLSRTVSIPGCYAGFITIRSKTSMAAAAALTAVSTTSKTTKNLLSVRVVSYNVLSSHLAEAAHFHKCHPDHLNADGRLNKIFSKLQEEMGSSSPIICLQEVSQLWAGKFHVFFAQHKYQMISGLYGKKFNGYMGVVLAYPTSIYDVLEVDIATLSDTREGGWPRPPLEEAEEGIVDNRTTTALTKLVGYATKILRNGFQALIVSPAHKLVGYYYPEEVDKPPPTTIDHWEYSENRKNVLIFARFREKHQRNGDADSSSITSTTTSFCVSNYHMPCAYFAPKVMTIHAEMAAQRTQRLAGSDPYLLVGDFNIQPRSSTYQLLTTGLLAPDDESYPSPSKYGMEWKAQLHPMKSAYATTPHGEPEFTNYAYVGNAEQPFQETLDYIFLSEHWNAVTDVKATYRKGDPVLANCPSFPNADEPSDHILIAATVQC